MTSKRPSRLIAAIVLGIALVVGLSPTAFTADWSETMMTVTRTYAGDGTTETWRVVGFLYEEEDDKTFYLPVNAVFSPAGIAGEAGISWAARDGAIYFKAGNRVSSVDVVQAKDRLVVPALDTIQALGISAAIINGKHLTIMQW